MPYSRFNGTITLPPAHSNQLALNQPTFVSSTGAGSSANVDDGDTNTYWQAVNTDTNAWWQINLENIYQIDTVQLIFPTLGNFCYLIQLSADNVNWTTVVDQSQNSSSEQIRTAVGNFGGGIQYLRVQFTNMPAGLTPGLAEVVVGGGSGLTYPLGQLSGTIIGTDGSSSNVAANVKESAMDWNTNTFFDGPDASGDWVGLDLGSSLKATIVSVGYCPRPDSGSPSFSSRMVGGVFQGANQPDFSDAVNLFTINSAPPQATITLQTISNPTTFRYVRYVSGPAGFCDVAELEFFQSATAAPNTVWSGAINGIWDTTTTNWSVNGAATVYQDGIEVQFDDTATGTTTVSASATRLPSAILANNSAKNYTIGGSAIGETASLTKSGTGTLTLTAANTFSGNVTVNTRTITINSPGVLDLQINNTFGQLGSGKNASPPPLVINGGTLKCEKVSDLVGAITLNGGTINANSASSVLNYKPSAGYLYSYLSYQLGGDVSVIGSTPSAFIAGQTTWDGISLNNTKSTFNVADVTGDSNVDLTVSCAIGDVNADYGGTKTACQLVKAGAGTMLLSGLNFYDGGTVISAGTLIVGNADNQTIPVINGSSAQANAAGALGKPGTTVTLGDANTTANNSSPALLIGGAYTNGHPIAIANQATTGTYTIGGSTDNNAAFTNLITVNQPLTISQVANTGGNALTLSGGITVGNIGLKTLTFSGPGNMQVNTTALSDGSGQLSVNLTGCALTLNTANTYTGATTVTNGTLLVNVCGHLYRHLAD
jgi:autotransporter-associated beta strand protein